MNILFPIDGYTEEQLYEMTENTDEGFFPIGRNHLWHGGVHLKFAEDKAVRAIADGEIVAYRINDEYPQYDNEPFSSGFVLIRHNLQTPARQALVFYSLYMHLRCLTNEATQDDTSPHSHVFKRTHWRVHSDSKGCGMPVFDAEANNVNGVIPFGAHFTVHPNDPRCDQDRFRNVTAYQAREYTVCLDDRDGISRGTPRGARVYAWNSSLEVLNSNRVPTSVALPTGSLIVIPDAQPEWVARFTCERVLALGAIARAGIAALDSNVNAVEGSHFCRSPSMEILLDESNSFIAQIPTGGVLARDPHPLPLPAWARNAPSPARPYVRVTWYPDAYFGYTMLENAARNRNRILNADTELRLWDERGTPTAQSVRLRERYHILPTPSDNTWAAHRHYRTIQAFDMSHGVTGWAFLVEELLVSVGALNIGGRARTLHYCTLKHLNRERWAEWRVDLLDDAAQRTAAIGTGWLLDIGTDAAAAADHWSRSTGWRSVTFHARAIQNQGALAFTGYAFLGPHTTLVGPGEGDNRIFRLDTFPHFTTTRSGRRKTLIQPPVAGVGYQLQKEGMSETSESALPWDGRHNGIEVRATGHADAQVLGILGCGEVLQFARDVPWQIVEGEIRPDVPGGPAFIEIVGGGYVEVTRDTLRKRCQIGPARFNTTVPLREPIPVRCGDVVGFTGRYRGLQHFVHFEIFSEVQPGAEKPSFVADPRSIRSLERVIRIEPTETFKYRLPITQERFTLPHGTSVRIIARSREYCQVEVLPVTGKLRKEDLAPPPTDLVLPPGVRPVLPMQRSLARDVSQLAVEELGGRRVTSSRNLRLEFDESWYHRAWNQRIPGRRGQHVTVLEDLGDVLSVRYFPPVELTQGWVDERQLRSVSESRSTPDLEADGRRFTLGAELAISRENPAALYRLTDSPTGTAPTNADTAALQTRIAELPRRRVFEGREFKEYIEIPWSDVLESEIIDTATRARSVWLGVGVTTAENRIWLRIEDAVEGSRVFGWLDWRFLKEDDDPDTRDIDESRFRSDGFCDIASLLGELGLDTADSEIQQGNSDAQSVTIGGALRNEEIARALRVTAVQFPSEWDMERDPDKLGRMAITGLPEADPSRRRFNAFLEHVKSQQFFRDVRTLPAADQIWHYHPLGFVSHLRRMSGISETELRRILPLATTACIDALNEALYKRSTSRLELAHLLGQVGEETAGMTAVFENGSEAYFRESYRQSVGNSIPNDAYRFRGRGLIQLTGRENYEMYEQYVRADFTSTDAAADRVATDSRYVADSLIWYMFVHKNLQAHMGAATPEAVRQLTLVVNGGLTHLGARMRYFLRARTVLHYE